MKSGLVHFLTFLSPECGSPYEDLFIPPTNLGSVTIAVQPEFGQVQSVLHHPDAQIQPYVADSQASNTTSPGWVSGNPFVNDSEARGEKRKRERGYELSAILPRDVLLKISSKDYEGSVVQRLSVSNFTRCDKEYRKITAIDASRAN